MKGKILGVLGSSIGLTLLGLGSLLELEHALIAAQVYYWTLAILILMLMAIAAYQMPNWSDTDREAASNLYQGATWWRKLDWAIAVTLMIHAKLVALPVAATLAIAAPFILAHISSKNGKATPDATGGSRDNCCCGETEETWRLCRQHGPANGGKRQ
ncbi:hypothetical protein [Marinobacter subterrani]|uniref:hypothetical protein n=1 Tax=Marinobacter subterrani TaxID=1658765 RepID=UPI0023567FF2|nr:hypothetical protein [Marinobacter subterrani]